VHVDDPCQLNPCLNYDVTCVDDPCLLNPCLNDHVTSVDDPCQLNPCLNGSVMSVDDPCQLNPCLNGGVCVSDNETGTSHCDCAASFVGDWCQVEALCAGDDVFLCRDGKTCIPRHWVCDSRVDCPDKSDRDDQFCGQSAEPLSLPHSA